jgi:hypothetical protein
VTRESRSAHCHAQFERARERAETERPVAEWTCEDCGLRWDAIHKAPPCPHRIMPEDWPYVVGPDEQEARDRALEDAADHARNELERSRLD